MLTWLRGCKVSQDKTTEAYRKLITLIGIDLYRSRAVLWGAEQLLTENSDMTISHAELASRVGQMIKMSEEHLERLADLFDQAETAFNCPDPLGQINELLEQAGIRP